MIDKFMSIEQQQMWIDAAIKLTELNLRSGSNDKLYEYILNQLTYVRDRLVDRSLPRDKLHEVNIGHLAIREFEGRDQEYSEALKRAYFIVDHMKRGLKIPLLDTNGNVMK